MLPSTVIIFITQEDIFSCDLAMYTFTEQCEEVAGLHLDDGTKKIFRIGCRNMRGSMDPEGKKAGSGIFGTVMENRDINWIINTDNRDRVCRILLLIS